MNNKDTKKEPVLVRDPATGEYVNVSGLFELQKEFEDFADLADNLDRNVIRFLNEFGNFDDAPGTDVKNMFHTLYRLTDAFRGMQVVKC